MIAFLHGVLAAVRDDAVIINVNGVGYLVYVPASTLQVLPAHKGEVHLHTHLLWREDGPHLFGFVSTVELETFRYLLNVAGIGPKGALTVLSAITPAALARAVAEGDINVLTRVPGVGKKTAQRIILELKDKLPRQPGNVPDGGLPAGGEDDALAALLALGYGETEARRAIHRVSPDGGTSPPGELVRAALQWLGRQK
ncbi:Holliday junction DNA helicase RuvA [Desulfotomaculum copahuensis]|uniref:Holliday junction branch migration complex subunit RuvA n=2 Tax=Desulfotomaculum copahuensis TaxID=1838280 RepID=A0A1B7LHH6_9FIRM|nr:Holliday junction DNA helicase RuvA [Desulfotomaculum copahuensis]